MFRRKPDPRQPRRTTRPVDPNAIVLEGIGGDVHIAGPDKSKTQANFLRLLHGLPLLGTEEYDESAQPPNTVPPHITIESTVEGGGPHRITVFPFIRPNRNPTQD